MSVNRIVRKFVAYFHFIGFDHWSLGLHMCPTVPNIEVHLPFGFIRLGWVLTYPDAIHFGPSLFDLTTYGIGARH